MIRILIFVLAMLCTGLAVSNPLEKTGKRDLIRATTEHLGRMIAFLEHHPWFLKSLTAAEKRQFELLMQVIRTLPVSKEGLLKIPLEFSSRREEFILNPGEPERSATTTDEMSSPVRINESILNSSDWDLIDAVSLLLHELGHKSGGGKRQAEMDQMIAKARTTLETVIKKQNLYMKSQNGRRFLRESIQYWSVPLKAGSVEPLTLLFDKTQIQSVNLAFLENAAQFRTSESRPEMQARILSLDAELIQNRINISVRGETEHGIAFFYSEELVYWDKGYTDVNFQNARSALGYSPAHPLSEVKNVRRLFEDKDKVVFEVTAHLEEEPSEIALTYGAGEDFTLLKGRVVDRSDKDWVLEFTFPFPLRSSFSLVDFDFLILDRRFQLELPQKQVLDFDEQMALSDFEVKRIDLQVRGQWVEFMQPGNLISIPKLRLRLLAGAFSFKGSPPEDIIQVRIRWKIISGAAGMRETRVSEEAIDASEMIQILTKEGRQIEFSSGILKGLPRGTLVQIKELIVTDDRLYPLTLRYSETLLLDPIRPFLAAP